MECVVAARFTGPLACFTDPARKGERATYPFATPSALVGLLESVYWHPQVKYSVREIIIEKMGRRFQITTNEMEKPSAPTPSRPYGVGDVLQRRSELLDNVSYVVRYDVGHETGSASEIKKTFEILTRRLKRKQFYRVPYLGRTQFPVDGFDYIEDMADVWPLSAKHDQNFGTMFLGRIYEGSRVVENLFFNAVMRNGRVRVPKIEDVYRELMQARAA